MNNQKLRKAFDVLEIIKKDFKVTNYNIRNKKVTIDFETNGDGENG